MATIVSLGSTGTHARFKDDPAAFFNHSLTEMHSLPREDLERLQLAAMRERFDEMVDRIPVLKTLSERQGITSLENLTDVVPLLFEHTMYKSYPVTLLERSRFDLMTEWLNKLTFHDLSGVSTDDCDSIDSWLDAIVAQTELDPVASSGSSGTISFIPKDRPDWARNMHALRVGGLQTFGVAPTRDDLEGKFDIIWPSYRDGHLASFRAGNYMRDYIAGGDDSMYHSLYPDKGSADIMFLSGRLRAAAARGADASKLKVPASLMARRQDLEEMQRAMPAQQAAFMERLVNQLKGKRVYGMGTWNLWYNVSKPGLEQGIEGVFAANSAINTGGGAKGMSVPDDWQDVVKQFLGVNHLNMAYGMTEIGTLNFMCEHGNYHLYPTIIPYVLDPQTSAVLPRSGVQRGRAAFFDTAVGGHWGGIITGDHVEVNFDGGCACGRKTAYVAPSINRFTELTGNEDKITCAATPQAHDEAMEFLTGHNG